MKMNCVTVFISVYQNLILAVGIVVSVLSVPHLCLRFAALFVLHFKL